jgi:hypothetical protein
MTAAAVSLAGALRIGPRQHCGIDENPDAQEVFDRLVAAFDDRSLSLKEPVLARRGPLVF